MEALTCVCEFRTFYVLASGISACGGGATDPPAPADRPRAAEVTITPAAAQLTALGETTRFSARVRDQNGQAMAGATVSWSSGNPSVATVDGSGLATAVGNGTAPIMATSGSASGSATVTVAQRVSAVSVTPAAHTMSIGDTLRLTAEATDRNGNAVTAGTEFAWTSSDTLVATVDGSGLATALAEGEAEIMAGVVTATGDVAGTSRVTVVSPDRAVLAALYEATGGSDWVANSGWLTGAPLRDWFGVTVDESGRVTGLNLPENNLNGPIPAELGGLANLTELWLDTNQLTGPIPSELGGLSNLTTLSLHTNGLTGPIPSELGGLANLTELSLYSNGLTGPIPSELGGLAALTTLVFGGNQLAGPIPSELGDLANLIYLDLGDNNLSGSIPSELGGLANLTVLWLHANALTGPIPQSFLQLSRLVALYIAGNSLCVPGTAAFTAWLNGVEAHDADEVAACPTPDRAVLVALYEATGGSDWVVNNGWLTGAPLGEWFGVTVDESGRVTRLNLPENNLNGSIPAELGGLAALTGLWLDTNQLTGPILSELGDLASLTTLALHTNGLTGPIPSELGGLANLTTLALDRNQLTGPLPQSFLQLSRLVALYIAGNSLCVPGTGAFTAWLNGIENHDAGQVTVCSAGSDR